MQKKTNGKAVASLVVSIVSIICCTQWYISLAIAVVGVVLGILGYRDNNPRQKDMAIAGIVIGAVGLALAVSVAIIYIIIYSNVAANGLTAASGIYMLV